MKQIDLESSPISTKIMFNCKLTNFCVRLSVHQAGSRVLTLVGVSWPFAGCRDPAEVSSSGESSGSSTCHLPLKQCK